MSSLSDSSNCRNSTKTKNPLATNAPKPHTNILKLAHEERVADRSSENTKKTGK